MRFDLLTYNDLFMNEPKCASKGRDWRSNPPAALAAATVMSSMPPPPPAPQPLLARTARHAGAGLIEGDVKPRENAAGKGKDNNKDEGNYKDAGKCKDHRGPCPL
eukprot:1392440-Pyramimonas_sp.AAC.2